jgi:hypothetical protein
MGERGGVPIQVENEKWRILPVGEEHDQPAALQAATGGTRHGEEYQQVGRSA